MKPQFQTFSDFILMGGYAPYVWLAWGLSLSVILILTVYSIIVLNRTKANFASIEIGANKPNGQIDE